MTNSLQASLGGSGLVTWARAWRCVGRRQLQQCTSLLTCFSRRYGAHIHVLAAAKMCLCKYHFFSTAPIVHCRLFFYFIADPARKQNEPSCYFSLRHLFKYGMGPTYRYQLVYSHSNDIPVNLQWMLMERAANIYCRGCPRQGGMYLRRIYPYKQSTS